MADGTYWLWTLFRALSPSCLFTPALPFWSFPWKSNYLLLGSNPWPFSQALTMDHRGSSFEMVLMENMQIIELFSYFPVSSMKFNSMSGFIFLCCLFFAKAQDLSSLINYKKFVADFFKEALVSYAENVVPTLCRFLHQGRRRKAGRGMKLNWFWCGSKCRTTELCPKAQA